jgi:hypothetical protein
MIEPQKLIAAATKLADDVHDLIAESTGVSGLHQNGQIAEWDTLMKGGQFEEWLGSLDDLDSVLAECLEQKNAVVSKAEASTVNERLLSAAEKYFTGYCQDEASEFGTQDTGCTDDQHKDAAELRDAIAAAKAEASKQVEPKPNAVVTGPIHVVCQCDSCEEAKAQPAPNADCLARACNLAGIGYSDFLKIKAYMPINPLTAPDVALDKQFDVRNIILDIVPGNGDGLEVYAKSVADVEKKLSELGAELEDWELGIKRLSTEPAPDSLLDLKLPIAVRVGGGIFGRGVSLRTVANHLARIADYSQELKDRMSKQSIQRESESESDVRELVEASRLALIAMRLYDKAFEETRFSVSIERLQAALAKHGGQS